MERRNVILGFVTLALIVLALFFLFKNPTSKTPQITTLPSPTTEEKLENKFNIKIPDDIDRVELTGSSDVSGVASRNYEAGLFSITVLTDLPESDQPYQAWIINENTNEFILMGELKIAKGGYILNFDISKDISDYKKIVINSAESKNPSEKQPLLQGVFK